MKIFGKWHLVQLPDTNRKETFSSGRLWDSPMWQKWYTFALCYFGKDGYESGMSEKGDHMGTRRMGFMDGYCYCLAELKMYTGFGLPLNRSLDSVTEADLAEMQAVDERVFQAKHGGRSASDSSF